MRAMIRVATRMTVRRTDGPQLYNHRVTGKASKIFSKRLWRQL